MKQKIVFTVHSFDEKYRGGVLRVVAELANKLSYKYHINIISFGPINELAYKLNSSISLISLNMKYCDTRYYSGLNKLKWFKNAYNKIKSHLDIESIFITSSPPLSLLFAYLKIQNQRIKVIGCDHTSTVYKNNFFIEKFRNFMLSKLDIMIGLNPQDVNYYIKNNINSICIPNGINLNKIDIDFNARNYLLFVGRLSPEKQPIKALNLYMNSNLAQKGIKFKIYGDGELFLEVKQYISENNFDEHIEVIANVDDINLIYKNAFALLLTSKTEGFPMVLLEALSKNIPCLSFKTPYGPLNIIKNGINGFFIEDNIEDFNKTIEKLYKLDTNNLYKTILEYNMEVILKKWEDLFLEI